MFRRLSLQGKLTGIILLASYAALVAAGTAFVFYERLAFRHVMTSTLATRAEIVASASTAGLSFNDPRPIEENLAALAADPHLIAATVFNELRQPVAQYVRADHRGGHPHPVPAMERSHRIEKDRLIVHQPVLLNGLRLGTVVLERDFTEEATRVRRYVAIVASLLLGSLPFTYLLARRLQRVISGPVGHLAQTAVAVAAGKNYSLRAVKHGDDELGRLVDNFNEMIAQIQARDTALQAAHDELERRVIERTGELTRANEQLRREITERRRAEEERKKLADLVEHSRDFIGLGTLDGRVLFINAAGRALTGLDSLEEACRLRIEDLYTPAMRAQFRDEIQPALQRHGYWQGESEMCHQRTGRAIPVHRSLFYIRDAATGAPLCLAAVIRDITEQHQAQAALRESEERFRTVFEGSPDAFFVEDAAGNVVDCNPAACRLQGLERHSLVGKNVRDLVPPERRAETARDFQKLVSGELRLTEGFTLNAAGAAIPVEVRSAPVLYGGQPCVLLQVRDITERHQLEAQLRHSQKMEAVGQLAAGVAHDFNNILTVIQGHTSLLLEEHKLDAEGETSLREIASSATRAANLTRQLLTFSRKQVMQLKPLDLNAVVADAMRMLRRLLGENITVEFDFAPALPAVLADTGMMEQIILNLVMNSRDAMPEGGKLSISTAGLELDAARAAQNPDARPGRHVCLTVRDTGTGMDAATQARIFEPFFTTKEVGKGTGLGLATVYGIVKQHQGWIEVESEPGRGAMFRIHLPATARRSENAAAGEPSPETRRGAETIFVVEDEPALRDLVAGLLRGHGYRVLTAVSGRDALRLWREQSPRVDLLLTDMMMPDGVSGWELARQLLVQSPKLKVVYTSGYSADLFANQVELEEGVNFISKPYQPRLLAQTIRNRLDRPVK